MAEHESQGPTVRERTQRGIQRVGTLVLFPPRTVLVLALGGPVLVARAVQWTVDRAAEEGERQLARLNGSLGRAAASLWP